MSEISGDSPPGAEDHADPTDRQLLAWILLSFGLGVGLVSAVLLFPEGTRPDSPDLPGVELVATTGIALCAITFFAYLARRRLRLLLNDDERGSVSAKALMAGHPYLALFVVSLVVLFLEVMFIRYSSGQFRIFAFYKNIPLISCFLGLGLGCFLGNARPRHALWFLLWMVPLAVFLSQGAHLVDSTISLLGALASSEFILGSRLYGNVELSPSLRLLVQIIIGGFCLATLVAIASTFSLLGRFLGTAFEQVPRLPGYTINILGSLSGILLFIALSYLQTPPWIWYLVGLIPLLGWIAGRARIFSALALIALTVAAVMPGRGETVWSQYQKLIGYPVDNGYMVRISDSKYQIALDLRPEAIARLGHDPAPHYNSVYQGIAKPDRVLVVGAGTGNDVAAALRAGASRVDAVEIDPAIVEIGRRYHPEQPYDDPRVRVIVDDARNAFRRLPAGSYDAVVFGLLDSHTQLGMSSVRLDNYVFTLESFAAARRLLKPGGSIILVAVDNTDWLHKRLAAMLRANCDTPVDFKSYGAPKSFVCQVTDPSRPPDVTEMSMTGPVPTDDWPFLYLPDRSIPQAYVIVILMLAAASVWLLWRGGLNLGSVTRFHTHMFFMGAAFLLMEVYAINRLALLFGTTWLVSAITIGLVLLLIVAANLTVTAIGRNLQKPAYAALFILLILSYGIEPGMVLGRGMAATLAYGLFILSPVYCAGVIFAHSFRVSPAAGPAIGANILGAVLGGWIEYATMISGIRSMALLALGFYLASLIALVIVVRRRSIQG
ncbi:MAG: methyltransferase domain-containing protein, partial [Proteobacteria bacterium]|nr:methyltransferase domain-containing protein [Pseudomonadota bacterium]